MNLALMRLDGAVGGSLLASPRNHRSAPRLSGPGISDLKPATCSDAKPADLPLVQPTNLEVVINVTTEGVPPLSPAVRNLLHQSTTGSIPIA